MSKDYKTNSTKDLADVLCDNAAFVVDKDTGELVQNLMNIKLQVEMTKMVASMFKNLF